MITAPQEVLAQEVNHLIKIALTSIWDIVGVALESLLRTVTLSAPWGVFIIVYNALEHLVLDQVRTSALGDKIDKYVNSFSEACKVANALGMSLLLNDNLIAQNALYVQAKTQEVIANRTRVAHLQTTSMAPVATGGRVWCQKAALCWKHRLFQTQNAFGRKEASWKPHHLTPGTAPQLHLHSMK